MSRKFIKRIVFISSFIIIPVFSFSQTMSNTGDWDDATKWSSGNIGDNINENVTLSGNTSPTVRSGFSYTIGNLTASGDNTLIINNTGSLTLGANGNAKIFNMTGINPKVTVYGTLTIWGNATFSHKVQWDIYGTVIVKGNLTMDEGTSMKVNTTGRLQVEGNMKTGNNSDIDVSGIAQIFHDLNVGSGNLNGGGTFEFGGNCIAGGGSFCDPSHYNSTLPVELLYFTATPGNRIRLDWATATEKNFDRFVIEHSSNGEHFQSVGEQKGYGNSTAIRKYAFDHHAPAVGKNYYRLRSIDLDLTEEYSPVVFAEFKAAKKLSMYPNPLTGSAIRLNANFQMAAGDKIEILDYLGTVISTEIVSETRHEIDIMKDIKPGVYILRYIGSGFSSLTRFTKQ